MFFVTNHAKSLYGKSVRGPLPTLAYRLGHLPLAKGKEQPQPKWTRIQDKRKQKRVIIVPSPKRGRWFSTLL